MLANNQPARLLVDEMTVCFGRGTPVVIADPSVSPHLLRVLDYADRLAELQSM